MLIRRAESTASVGTTSLRSPSFAPPETAIRDSFPFLLTSRRRILSLQILVGLCVGTIRLPILRVTPPHHRRIWHERARWLAFDVMHLTGFDEELYFAM
jgi:hypothetical protein